MKKYFKITSKFFLISFFLFVISKASGSEKLFYITTKSNWQSQTSSLTIQDSANIGSISLIPEENIIEIANRFFFQKGSLVLVHLELPTNDRSLKWKNEDSCGISIPYYLGQLSKKYIANVYSLEPGSENKYQLPKKFLKQNKKPILLPGLLVTKVLNYQNWQNKKRLYKIDKNNYKIPLVQLQWWYFDFFLQDGSTIVFALIPESWWGSKDSLNKKNSLLMISRIDENGKVEKLSYAFPQNEINVSENKLSVNGKFSIVSNGIKNQRQYALSFNFQNVKGSININQVSEPYAPYPTGIMPGYLQTLISGAPKGSPSFSYVAQIPDGNLSGELLWENKKIEMNGRGYHEQGRLDDTPENQACNWFWYHFSSEDWNIFGSPGTVIFIQKNTTILKSGFHLVPSHYTISNRSYTSVLNPKILTGGEINFKHKNLDFRLTMNPCFSKPLISYISNDTNQVWSTVNGKAIMVVKEKKDIKIVEGKMLLETCSWGKSLIP